MNKQEFLTRLRKGLSGIPQEDAEERLGFYAEMIDDRMEDGLSEEEAVAAVGDVDDIISQVIEGTPLAKILRERVKPGHKLKTWEIVLLAVSSPIWIMLLFSVLAIALYIYILLWAIVASLWTIEFSLAIYGVLGIPAGILTYAFNGSIPGCAVISSALISAGLGMIMFFGCIWMSKKAVVLTKKITNWIKTLFIRKENN